MAENLMLRKESGWMVIFTCPDVCKTPPCIPVPYPVVAFLKDSDKVQDNVKANNHPFVLHDKSCVTTTWGDQLGILKGIKSQTVGAECYPIDKSGSFRVNGKWTVRADDAFWMNGNDGKTGNTRGKVIKIPSMKEMLTKALDVLQVGLDLVGLIPGLGEIADGINAVIYLARGDYANAALSAAAMIPFAGWAATGAKLGTKAVKATKAGIKAAEIAAKAKKAAKAVGAKIKAFWDKLKCPKCKPLRGNPVNPIYGSKLELGEKDTDFILNSALPLQWTRTYSSDSPIGTDQFPIAWYGQGWDTPYSIQIKVLPALEKIEILLPLGQVVPCPYLEQGDDFYILQYDLTIVREIVPNEDSSEHSYKFRLCTGTLASANSFFEFDHQVKNTTLKPEYLVLCTGNHDLHGNRIGLEYLYTDEVRKNYPSHIYDAIDRVLALDFVDINDQVRLREIKHLQGLSTLEEINPKNTGIALSISERLFQAEQLAHRELMDLDDFVNAKVLSRYDYSDEGDLIHVYVDDSPVEAKSHSAYKLRLTRKFEWKNHIMTAHHVIGGTSSYYEYNEYSIKGKVTRHWINTGEEFLFQYHDGYTDVVSAPNTDIQKTERFYFDEYNYLTQYVDGLGHSEFYQYNNKQQMIRKTDADGGITEYQYSGSQLTKIRSLIEYHATTKLPQWREISLTWSQGHLTGVTDPLGNTQTTAYDFAGQPLVITDALGRQTQIKYTSNGMAYQVTDAKGGHKRMLWDLYGNLTKYQDCSGKTTQYTYDDYGRLSKVTNAAGHETQFKYYAHQQQPQEIIYPDGSNEQFKYDVLERLIEYRDALGRTTSYAYSYDDLPIRRIDAANGVVSYHYDNLRRFVSLTNENGKSWNLKYDANDRLIEETTFDGVRTEYEYSPAGHLIKHRQLNDHKKVRYSTIFKRDLLGQLLEQYIIDHHDLSEKKRTRYDYDLSGQLLQARNQDSHIKLDYDAVGQLTKEQLIAHWLNTETKEHVRRSHTLTHLYDELGNRIETTLPDGRKLKTMYYGSGHAWNYALEDSQGIHEISSLERDDLHQEIQRSQGQLQSAFKLDPMGRLTAHHVNFEQSSHEKKLERLYEYDKAGQLKQILDKRFVSQDHVWQRTQNYHYDVLSRLTGSELSTLGKSENYIQIREKFAFDPASNILPVASAQNQSHEKIDDNRVRHLEQEHQTVHYKYDDLGRIVQKQIRIKDKNAFGHIQAHLSQTHLLNQFTTRQIDLAWDEQNQLQESTSTKPDSRGGQEIIKTQYCYDPFGRRIAKQSQIYKKQIAVVQSYSNQLGDQTKQPNPLQLLRKDAVWNVWDGNRILQDHNGKHVFTTVYEADSFVPLARLVWLEDKLTEAANDSSNHQVDIQKMDQLKQIALQNIGEIDGIDLSQTDTQNSSNDEPPRHLQHQLYWYQNDHLGTPRELTSNSGNIEWEAVYQAWGNTVTVEWQEVAQVNELNPIQLNEVEKAYLLQPHRFQGQIYDSETGLHYNRFRYYDPDAGRFISHDPIGLLGGKNNFQYVPNPVEWVDPYGLAKCKLSKKDKKAMGPKPKDMKYPHRHHIVRENAPCSWSDSNRRYIIVSQLLAQKYIKDFDLNKDLRNFVWAENGCGVHSKESAKMVFDKMTQAKRDARKQGKDIGEALEGAISDLGKIFNNMR